MKTKFRTLLSLSLAAFMFLSACSSSPQGSASDPGADQSAPVSQNPVIPDSGDGPWYAGYGEPEYGGEIVFASNRFTEKLLFHQLLFPGTPVYAGLDCRPK